MKTARRRRGQGHRAKRRSAKVSAPRHLTVAASAAVNSDLDGLLVGRGWTLVERSRAGDVYDWLASASIADHEPTYVIVAANCVRDPEPPYRVWLVDGRRLAYDSAAGLAADLDRIETHRCCSL